MVQSISALLDETVKRYRDRPAIKLYSDFTESWTTKNWGQFAEDVARCRVVLKKLGIMKGERVAILSTTRPEWVTTDLAILGVQAVTVPIYHSSVPEQIAFILRDSRSSVIFVEDEVQLKKVRLLEREGITFKKIIIFNDYDIKLLPHEVTYSLLLKEVDHHEIAEEEKAHLAITNPDPLASIVYTSGTTGEPKGAMIAHDNLLYEAHAIDKLGILTPEDVQLIFLPLAHIFARVLEIAWIRTGHLLVFARGIDKIVDDMADIKPTFMAAVPRVYEKIYAKVVERAESAPGIKGRLARWAFAQGRKLAEKKQVGQKFDGCRMYFAETMVYRKVGKTLRERLGGRLRFFISGGAPLSLEVAYFFRLCEVILCEGYGLTETTAATCLNLPWAMRIGTVGKPLPGMEVKLAEDGEILIRGRGVFLGFWRDEEASAQVLLSDGWFKSGDVGQIDPEGFLQIVDRKKDLIITAGGKNIAPQYLENRIKAHSPLIAHVVVIGDKKPYLTALIALDKSALSEHFHASPKKDLDFALMARDSQVFKRVSEAVNFVNVTLPSYEQIKRFRIVEKEFEIGDELTPTLKVKRKVCVQKFQKEIKMLYA